MTVSRRVILKAVSKMIREHGAVDTSAAVHVPLTPEQIDAAFRKAAKSAKFKTKNPWG